MGVARQASTLAAAGLVEELKAESEKKREHELDKRFGVAQELSVSRLIMEIDGVLDDRCKSNSWKISHSTRFSGNALSSSR